MGVLYIYVYIIPWSSPCGPTHCSQVNPYGTLGWVDGFFQTPNRRCHDLGQHSESFGLNMAVGQSLIFDGQPGCPGFDPQTYVLQCFNIDRLTGGLEIRAFGVNMSV